MGILYSSGDGTIYQNMAGVFNGARGFSFLVFNLLCAPCFAAMGAIKREMNNTKWFWFAIGYQCGLAYLASLVVYRIAGLFTGACSFGIWSVIAILIVAFFGFLSMELSLDYDYHAIVVAYLFYIFYDKPLLGASLGYISIIKELYSFIGFGMTLTYNGERGKQYKWFNYFFYPVHMLILGLLRIYLNI